MCIGLVCVCVCSVWMRCTVDRPDGDKLLLDPRRDATKPFLGLVFKLEASSLVTFCTVVRIR